jgi:hypothetical protein
VGGVQMSVEIPEYYFDACAMIGKSTQRRSTFSSVDDLLAQMASFGIAKALVSHSISFIYDFREGDEILVGEIAGHAKLTPCYTVIPFTTGEMPGPAFWDGRLAETGPFAFKIYPRTHVFMLRSLAEGDLFSYVEERKIPLFVEIDEIDYVDLWSVCSDHPKLRLIIGNRGTHSLFGIYREFRRIYEFLERFEDVALETSFLIGFRGIEDICDRYGAERLVYGSRMPSLEPGSSVARIQYAEIGLQEKELIAHGNIERLLGEVVR